MNDTFSIETSFPPSLSGSPILALLTVMSCWAFTLVVLQWLYTIVDDNRDFPAPKRSYIQVARRVKFWLLLSAFLLAAPRLLQLMVWQRLSPDAREIISMGAWLACIPCAAMVAFAWWSDKEATATEAIYVRQNGFVAVTPTTRTEKTRGAIILVLIFVVAFATTFVRPRPQDVRHSHTVDGRR